MSKLTLEDMAARVLVLEQAHTALSRQVYENGLVTNKIKEDTSQLVSFINDGAGTIRMLSRLFKAAKWIVGILAMIGIAVGFDKWLNNLLHSVGR